LSKSEYSDHIDSMIVENKLEESDVFGGLQYLYKFDFGAENELARFGYAKLSPTFENDELWRLNLYIQGKTDFDLPVVQFGYLEEMYKLKYGKFEYGETNDFESTWTFNNMDIVLTMRDEYCSIVYTDLDKLESFQNEPTDTEDI